MSTDLEADLRRAMILALAANRVLLDRLDGDDLDQLGLIDRTHELCELIQGDLDRLASKA